MKLFVELKCYFEYQLDIRQNQKNVFNIRNLMALFFITSSFVAIVAYMVQEENSIFEYGNLFYGAISFLLNIITLLSNILKQKKIFNIIDKLESTIENSEFLVEKF